MSEIEGDNPYQPPGDRGSVIADSTTYYQTQSTKLTLREYWRSTNTWFEFVLAVVFKTLRIRIPFSFAYANTRELERLTPQELSTHARDNLKPLIDQARALGLQYAFCYGVPLVGTAEGTTAVLFSPDHRFISLIIHVRIWTPQVINEKTEFSFVSRLSDETVLATSGAIHELELPPWFQGESLPGSTMETVLSRHNARLEEIDPSTIELVKVDQLEQTLRDYEQKVFDFHTERGIFAPISNEKRAELQELLNKVPEEPQPKPKPLLKRTEWVCWIALIIQMFAMEAPTAGASISQALFRFAMLVVPLGIVTLIWIARFVLWIQRRNKG